MIKKTIKYRDLDGNELEEDFYFNLSKSELGEMMLRANGDIRDQLKAVIATEDNSVIYDKFKEILSSAFGRRSESGKAIIKKPEYWEEFEGSEAWDNLFMEMFTDAAFAAKFISAMMPADLGDNVEVVTRDGKVEVIDKSDPDKPQVIASTPVPETSPAGTEDAAARRARLEAELAELNG